jgi:hypothetical protein
MVAVDDPSHLDPGAADLASQATPSELDEGGPERDVAGRENEEHDGLEPESEADNHCSWHADSGDGLPKRHGRHLTSPPPQREPPIRKAGKAKHQEEDQRGGRTNHHGSSHVRLNGIAHAAQRGASRNREESGAQR